MTTNTSLDDSDVVGAIKKLQSASDRAAVSKPAFIPIVNAAGVVLTAAQVLGGVIARSGAAVVSDTLPTAALLVAAFAAASAAGAPPAVGDVVTLRLRNNNSGILTLLVGTGITLEGTTTVTNAFCREFLIRFTNVTAGAEAVTVSGLFQAAV